MDEIGWFGARAFTDAAALNRREIDLAVDVMPSLAKANAANMRIPRWRSSFLRHLRHDSKKESSSRQQLFPGWPSALQHNTTNAIQSKSASSR